MNQPEEPDFLEEAIKNFAEIDDFLSKAMRPNFIEEKEPMLDRATIAYERASTAFYLDYLEHVSSNVSPQISSLNESDYCPDFSDPEDCGLFFMGNLIDDKRDCWFKEKKNILDGVKDIIADVDT